jgi:hypothetical protein
MPITSAAMPPTFSTVSTDCTRPPKATLRQLIAANSMIAATATTCVTPNCQSIGWPRSVNVVCAQTARIGSTAPRNVAKPTPRIAIDPVPLTKTRVQP